MGLRKMAFDDTKCVVSNVLFKPSFVKMLCVAVLLGTLNCLSIAQADEYIPTLDALAGQPIPNTSPIQYYPNDLASAYSLTKINDVDNFDWDNFNGDLITLYEINPVTRALEEVYYVLNYKNPLDGIFTPTLTSLAGQPVPNTNPVEYYPDNLLSGYTLTQIQNPDPNNLPANAVILYTENPVANVIEPVYYVLNLAKTTYGTGDTTKYFEFQENFQGNFDLNEVITPTLDKTTITINYDSNSLTPRTSIASVTDNVTGSFIQNDSGNLNGGAIYNTNQIGFISGIFVENNSSKEGGAIYNNSGSIGSVAANFIKNQVTGSAVAGGAIYNGYNASISNITGDFIDNSSTDGGGAIINYDNASIGNIVGNFIENSTNDAGGAIYNQWSSIHSITGDFIENYVSGDYGGGAISNYSGTIDKITGDFINNNANKAGGAIYNVEGSFITSIIGDFIGNSANTNQGGAIYNSGMNTSIGSITGDFINNNALVAGGAISNVLATITSIEGDFIGNNVIASAGVKRGGAISNTNGTIGSITGNFIGNYILQLDEVEEGYGGAISNTNGTIENITGDFISNYAEWSSGAIINENARIGNITGDFINNVSFIVGGISNVREASISDIVGIFIGNESDSDAGAITNTQVSTINNITADFINNNCVKHGGAIFNYMDSSINNITGDFINNSAGYLGGAICNIDSTIDTITGNFIKNRTNNVFGGAIYDEGATGTQGIQLLTASFIENSAISGDSNNPARGGAIWSNNSLNIFTDDRTIEFTGNYTETAGIRDDNAIWMDNSDAVLTLNASGNGKIIMNDNVNGNTGYNVNLISRDNGEILLFNNLNNADVTTDQAVINFSNNEIYNYEFLSLTTDDEDSKFKFDIDITNSIGDKITTTNNSYNAVYVDSLNLIAGDFDNMSPGNQKIQLLDTPNEDTYLVLSNNIVTASETLLDTIEQVTSNIIKDVYYDDTFELTTSSKEIYGTIGLDQTSNPDDSISLNISRIVENTSTVPDGDTLMLWNQFDINDNKNFIFDKLDTYYATTDLGETKGSTLNINGFVANDESRAVIDLQNNIGFEVKKDLVFNVRNVSIENSSGSVFDIQNDNVILNLTNVDLKNNDNYAIYSKGDVNITADRLDVNITSNVQNATGIYIDNVNKTLTFNLKNTGSITQNDNIDGVTTFKTLIKGDDVNSNIYNMYGQILNADLSIENATVNTINDIVNVYTPHSLTITEDMKMLVDVDLANSQMDRFDADTYGNHIGSLIVEGMNLLSDSQQDITIVPFAEYGLKDNVTTTITEIGDGVSNQYQTVYAPIYKYHVDYERDSGNFLFRRWGSGTAGGTGQYLSFNPSILSSSVGALVGTYLTQLNSFDMIFNHIDMRMNLTSKERTAMKLRNKYASSQQDLITFSPNQVPEEMKGLWFRPYTIIEKVRLDNGPKVSNLAYGSYFGGDTDLIELKNGWDVVFSGYAAYNGSHQSYNGISIYQNGAQLGATATLYKNNFFTALTSNVGASIGEASTMYGQEDFTMLGTGIASKTGYNFEFNEGKFIIQPNYLMSYSFINTFDYTNAAGVKIQSDPLHAIQFAPGVKFIANYKNGWQPYASVQMVWNILDSTRFRANDVSLPRMSIDPYVQYGIGVQKRWGDRFTGFFQSMIRNGGRTGIALTTGFRWALDKD